MDTSLLDLSENKQPTVLDGVTALEITKTMLGTDEGVGVVAYQDNVEYALADEDVSALVKYFTVHSVLLGETVSRIQSTAGPQFRILFSAPVRVVYRKRTLVVVDTEV